VTQTVLMHTLLLVCVGLSLEVIYTAAIHFKKAGNLRLQGYTYVWMIPIYALVYPILTYVYPFASRYPFLLRGTGYVAAIYFVEYTSGWLLRKLTGECPWEREYRGSRWSIHDLIRLDMAPGWLGAAFIFETVYRSLRGL
jgi:hypothetical protein